MLWALQQKKVASPHISLVCGAAKADSKEEKTDDKDAKTAGAKEKSSEIVNTKSDLSVSDSTTVETTAQ